MNRPARSQSRNADFVKWFTEPNNEELTGDRGLLQLNSEVAKSEVNAFSTWRVNPSPITDSADLAQAIIENCPFTISLTVPSQCTSGKQILFGFTEKNKQLIRYRIDNMQNFEPRQSWNLVNRQTSRQYPYTPIRNNYGVARRFTTVEKLWSRVFWLSISWGN